MDWGFNLPMRKQNLFFILELKYLVQGNTIPDIIVSAGECKSPAIGCRIFLTAENAGIAEIKKCIFLRSRRPQRFDWFL